VINPWVTSVVTLLSWDFLFLRRRLREVTARLQGAYGYPRALVQSAACSLRKRTTSDLPGLRSKRSMQISSFRSANHYVPPVVSFRSRYPKSLTLTETSTRHPGKIEFYLSQAQKLGLPQLPVHNVDKNFVVSSSADH
jgi:hypothetical protein